MGIICISIDSQCYITCPTNFGKGLLNTGLTQICSSNMQYSFCGSQYIIKHKKPLLLKTICIRTKSKQPLDKTTSSQDNY